MPRYRGLLKWLPEKGCWEVSVTDHEIRDVRIQPRGVFSEDALLGQLGVIAVPAERVEFTGYTCEVYPPASMDKRGLAAQARRFIIMLGARYMLHGRQRVEWHLYRQRYG